MLTVFLLHVITDALAGSLYATCGWTLTLGRTAVQHYIFT